MTRFDVAWAQVLHRRDVQDAEMARNVDRGWHVVYDRWVPRGISGRCVFAFLFVTSSPPLPLFSSSSLCALVSILCARARVSAFEEESRRAQCCLGSRLTWRARARRVCFVIMIMNHKRRAQSTCYTLDLEDRICCNIGLPRFRRPSDSI